MTEARPTGVHGDLMRQAVALAAKKDVRHLLYIGDLPLGEDLIRMRGMRRKLVQAVTAEAQRVALEAAGVRSLTIPPYDLARQEKLKLALVSGIGAGMFQKNDVVLALVR